MKWEEFIKSRLGTSQAEVLKCALKLNVPVHFYGVGLGKSIIVEVLNEAGFNASDPADLQDGSCSVPDDSLCRVCFNIKEGAPEFVPELRKILLSQKDEIIKWVNL